MHVHISNNPEDLGMVAGRKAADIIRRSIDQNGHANIILATGTSQFSTLQTLIQCGGIDWEKITMFHLDEYIGIGNEHPASFRKYLYDRFISQVPIKDYFLIDGMGNPEKQCKELGEKIGDHPIDVALIGIGENGHLAFNDPPADLDTLDPYIIVTLDEACRRQQLGEGWFKTISDVPQKAISMSVNQILEASTIICSVPDQRKAEAVKNTLFNGVDKMFPSTALQLHPSCFLYLDKASASLLPPSYLTSAR